MSHLLDCTSCTWRLLAPLAFEVSGTVLTTNYIVAKQDAAVQLSKRGGQLRDIDQLTVAAHASVKEDEEVDGVSVMQKAEEDVGVQGPHYCQLEAQLDGMMQVEHVLVSEYEKVDSFLFVCCVVHEL